MHRIVTAVIPVQIFEGSGQVVAGTTGTFELVWSHADPARLHPKVNYQGRLPSIAQESESRFPEQRQPFLSSGSE